MHTEFFWFVTLMDLTAAVIIFVGALSERLRLYPIWHKIGLMVAVLGLVAQAFRNVRYIFTGESPSDADMPLWVMKDAGIAIIAYYYLWKAVQPRFFPDLSPKPQVKAKRKTK